MEHLQTYTPRPRIFNTSLESGLRSLILLTACYPHWLSLRKLVVLDHLVVHTGDLSGPPSLHPKENSRTAELLVRRGLVSSGLSLMGTRALITRHATHEGFRYRAGEEAGTFVDFLKSDYSIELKERAEWLSENIVSLTDDDFEALVHERLDIWESEFQVNNGKVG